MNEHSSKQLSLINYSQPSQILLNFTAQQHEGASRSVCKQTMQSSLRTMNFGNPLDPLEYPENETQNHLSILDKISKSKVKSGY